MGEFMTERGRLDSVPVQLSYRGRRFRLSMGWTLEQVATRMGCSKRTLIRLEGDNEAVRAASLGTILEWCRALGLGFIEFQRGDLPRVPLKIANRCRSPRAGRP